MKAECKRIHMRARERLEKKKSESRRRIEQYCKPWREEKSGGMILHTFAPIICIFYYLCMSISDAIVKKAPLPSALSLGDWRSVIA